MTSKLLIMAVMAASLPTALSAQSNRELSDQQHSWAVFTGTHRISDRWALYTEYQWRRADGLNHWQQSLLRAGMEYKFNQHITAMVGYAWIETFPYGDFPVAIRTPEHRIWQQVAVQQELGRFTLQHRYRLEQRYSGKVTSDDDGAPAIHGTVYTNRIRYRILANFPLDESVMAKARWFLSLSDEPFISFGKHVGKNILDQNRLYGGIGYQVRPGHTIQVGYLNQLIAKADGLHFENNHTIQASFNWNLDFSKSSENKSGSHS